jgi:hypothetical protein
MGLFSWKKKKEMEATPEEEYAKARKMAEETLQKLKENEGHENLHLEFGGVEEGKHVFRVFSYDEEMEESDYTLEELLEMDLVTTSELAYSDTFKTEIIHIWIRQVRNNKKIKIVDADRLVRYVMNQLDIDMELLEFNENFNVDIYEVYRYLIAPTGKARVSDGSRRIPEGVKNAVWNRDNGCCVYCGSSINIEFDHIIPFSKGGANTFKNIQILCQSCNRAKSNKIG